MVALPDGFSVKTSGEYRGYKLPGDSSEQFKALLVRYVGTGLQQHEGKPIIVLGQNVKLGVLNEMVLRGLLLNRAPNLHLLQPSITVMYPRFSTPALITDIAIETGVVLDNPRVLPNRRIVDLVLNSNLRVQADPELVMYLQN
jgi:hypothetical protein